MSLLLLFQPGSAAASNNASVSQTLGGLTLASTVVINASGSLASALGSLGLSSTAAVLDTGSLAKALGALGISAAATVGTSAAVDKALGDITLASTGAVIDSAAVNKVLGDLVLSGTGTVAGNYGTVNQTLGALTINAAGAVIITATMAEALLNLSLSSSAQVGQIAAVRLRSLGKLLRSPGRRRSLRPFEAIAVGETDWCGFDITADADGASVVSTEWTCEVSSLSPRGTDPAPQDRVLRFQTQSALTILVGSGNTQITKTGLFALVELGTIPSTAAHSNYLLTCKTTYDDGRILESSALIPCTA